MIFLPNKFERYTAALRAAIHNSAAKHGKTDKQLSALRKIYIAEAAYFKNEKRPVNSRELCSVLLKAVYIKKLERDEYFEFELKPVRNCLINPKFIIAVLLTVCRYSESVRVVDFDGNIKIEYKSDSSDIIAKELKHFGVTAVSVVGSRTGAVLLFCDITAKPTEHYFADFSELTAPFSPIDIFI